jgi:hypothetical protein
MIPGHWVSPQWTEVETEPLITSRGERKGSARSAQSSSAHAVSPPIPNPTAFSSVSFPSASTQLDVVHVEKALAVPIFFISRQNRAYYSCSLLGFQTVFPSNWVPPLPRHFGFAGLDSHQNLMAQWSGEVVGLRPDRHDRVPKLGCNGIWY